MPQHVLALIASDHREVEGLFARFRSLTPGDEDRAAVVGRIIRELAVYAVVEEMLLYPAVRGSVPDGAAVADHALDEHQEIKDILARLDGMDADDAELAPLVERLAAAVRQHVEEEERGFVPALRDAVGADDMLALGRKMERAKAVAPTRPHPHAPNRPPGNLIVGLPVAVLDRVRDALDSKR